MCFLWLKVEWGGIYCLVKIRLIEFHSKCLFQKQGATLTRRDLYAQKYGN